MTCISFSIFCLLFHSGQALRSQLQRWCWSGWNPSPQMALSSLSPSWHSGWRGPDRDCSSCCACVCTTASSLWWTSTTAPFWPTSPCPPQIARASTSTALCSALWAQSLSFCPTPSGTRRISTPSVSSAWLWQLFPSWAFSWCLGCYAIVSKRKSFTDRMRHRHSKSKELLKIFKLSFALVEMFLVGLVIVSFYLTPPVVFFGSVQVECWPCSTYPSRKTRHHRTVPQTALQTQELHVVCVHEPYPGKMLITWEVLQVLVETQWKDLINMAKIVHEQVIGKK